MKNKIKILAILFILFTPFITLGLDNISKRLSGKILLQVESKGEAYYVYPDNLKRYSLGLPSDAFNIMRELGLGVSNFDFDSWNEYAPKNLSGKILLKVEDKGQAYYVNPDDLKMYYLGLPSDAFQIMRNLGLGITNNDINKIDIQKNPEESTPVDVYANYSNPRTNKILTPQEWAAIVTPYGKNPTTGDYYTLKEILIDGLFKNCRPETFVVTPLSSAIDGSQDEYFKNVIESNAPINVLEAIKITLLNYKNNFINNPDPFGIHKKNEGIAYSPKQLNEIDEAYQPLYEQYINFLDSWMVVTDEIIFDKKDNNCIDGNFNDFVMPPSIEFDNNSKLLSATAVEEKQYEDFKTQEEFKQKQEEEQKQKDEEYAKWIFCNTYQIEKTKIDNSYPLFSGAKVKAQNDLKARYPGCF